MSSLALAYIADVPCPLTFIYMMVGQKKQMINNP